MGVPISVAGLLVSLHGGIAAVTAAPLTALLGRIDRRWLLGVLIVGNVVSALAPTYLLLMLSGIPIAFAHGVFWSTAGSRTSSSSVPDALAALLAEHDIDPASIDHLVTHQANGRCSWRPSAGAWRWASPWWTGNRTHRGAGPGGGRCTPH